MKSKVVLLSSFAALLPLLSPGFDLVKDGIPAEIVLPEKPHPSTLLAAQELADYTEKVTGKKPAVVKGGSSASAKVFIGTLDTLKDIPASAVKALKSAKQDEAHFICAKGNTLYIIGKQEVADLYATYQFIEDKLGVPGSKNCLDVLKTCFSGHPGRQFRDPALPDAFSDIFPGTHGNLQSPIANGMVFHPGVSGRIRPADPNG